MSETKNIVIDDLNRRKCITFDKAAQDVLPEHIKEKMKADRETARKRDLCGDCDAFCECRITGVEANDDPCICFDNSSLRQLKE